MGASVDHICERYYELHRGELWHEIGLGSVGSTAGVTPAGAALLSAFFVLVALKTLVNHALAVPSAAGDSAKEGSVMKRVKYVFASVPGKITDVPAGAGTRWTA